MANIDLSLLDVPRSVPVEDPEAYLHAAIAWHFGEDTGSAFWLRTAKTLDFNPLTDIKTFADFVARRQHVHPATRWEGQGAVALVLEQLTGFAAPADLWETDLLPRRLRDFRPAWLDELENSIAGTSVRKDALR